MNYSKPVFIVSGDIMAADCRPNSKPCGRPCNPPAPRGGK